MNSQQLAKGIWQQIDPRTILPHGDPDWVVIRDLTKHRPGHKPIMAIAMSLYTAKQNLTPEDLDLIVRAIHPRKTHDTKVQPGDSLGIFLKDQPFPHRTWVVTDVDEEGVIHVRSGDKLGADGHSLPSNSRVIEWHSPPSEEHLTAKLGEEPFLDAWVSLRSAMEKIPLWWTTEVDSFGSIADVFIEAGFISDESDADITEEEWLAVPGGLQVLCDGLVKLDHDAYGKAHQVIRGLLGLGLDISRKATATR